MKKQLIYLGLVLIGLMFAQCAKEVLEFVPDKDQKVTSGLFVTVVDDDGKPLENATINYLSVNYHTNKFGIARIKNVKVSSRHSVATVFHEGYFGTTKVFNAQTSAEVFVKVLLRKKEYKYTIDAANGGSITTNDGVVLKFPANSIKVENNESPYSGNVKIAVRYIDPTSTTLVEEMPGDLTAITSTNRLDVLTTFGMVQVEMVGSNGESLNVKDGNKVEMSANIPASLLAKAPETIAMWHFEDATGYWREEGSATKVGNKYIAYVGHFSCWNYDYNDPSVFVTGKLIDQNGNALGGLYVSIHNANTDGGGHGYANSDGTFGGRVPANVPLKMKVYGSSYCQGNPIYTANIGPFSVDTDLGSVVINFTPDQQFEMTADLVDCDGNPVANGAIRLNLGNNYSQYLPADASGHVSVIIPICNDLPGSTVIALDLDNLVQGEPVSVTVPGVNNLGTITACGNAIDFISINAPDLGINNFNLVQGLNAFSSDSSGTTKFLLGYTEGSGMVGEMSITYDDGTSTGNFITGIFTGSAGFISLREGGTSKTISMQNISVTVTQGGGAGSKLIGSYAAEYLIQGDPNLKIVTGNFKLPISN